MARKSSFDWKGFMLQKGDRVALGFAGFLTLILFSCSVPRIFSVGAEKRAADLNQKTAQVRAKRTNNTPTKPDEIAPNKEQVNASLGKFESSTVLPWPYRLGWLFFVEPPGDNKRRQPDLYIPVEGRVAIVQGQLWSYMFRMNKDKLEIKVKVKDQPGAGMPPPMATDPNLARLAKNFRGTYGQQRQVGVAGFGDRPDVVDKNAAIKTDWVAVDTLEGNLAVDQMLRTIKPVRMAVIAASFPYKAQVEEFRKKLKKPNFQEVLEEASVDDDVDENAGGANPQRRKLESFRFINVVVERRQVDRLGSPIFKDAGPYKNGWVPLDMVGAYKPLLVLSNLQTEDEDKTLEPVMMDGLVMPRLYSARADQYPPIERDLTTIAQTLTDLEKAKAAGGVVAKVNNFNSDDFDLFSGRSRNQPAPGTAAPPTAPPTLKGGRILGTKGTTGAAVQDDKFILPEYCLIRVIDVTVRPAESYQYRLRVNMANPNFGRTANEVFLPQDADNKILEPKDKEKMWFEIPGIVTVPSEMHYYAVDEKAAFNGTKVGPDQTVLQIHKYLENAASGKGKEVPVGEWSVAERVIVARGEAIDRDVRVQVPVLVEEEGKWKLASTVGIELGKPREPGIAVRFNSMPLNGTTMQREAVLVDFDGKHEYKRAEAAKTDKPASDVIPPEVLILAPDGKLLAHHAAVDEKDKERTDRYADWKKRIDEVRTAMKADPMNPMNTGGIKLDSYGRPIKSR